jgi:hypothetical protein
MGVGEDKIAEAEGPRKVRNSTAAVGLLGLRKILL